MQNGSIQCIYMVVNYEVQGKKKPLCRTPREAFTDVSVTYPPRMPPAIKTEYNPVFRISTQINALKIIILCSLDIFTVRVLIAAYEALSL